MRRVGTIVVSFGGVPFAYLESAYISSLLSHLRRHGFKSKRRRLVKKRLKKELERRLTSAVMEAGG